MVGRGEKKERGGSDDGGGEGAPPRPPDPPTSFLRPLSPPHRPRRAHAQTPVTGWLEAFASHPVLGDTAKLAAAAPSAHTALSASEQAGVGADPAGAAALAAANAAYAARFGHTFIACAAGRGAADLAAELEARTANPPYAELAATAAEQMKITERRLAGLVGEKGGTPAAAPAGAPSSSPPPPAPAARPSPLTTHVLDTAAGVPAAGVPVALLARPPGAPPGARVWVSVGRRGAATNADGRVVDLLPPAPDGHVEPPPGAYRLEFGMGARGGGGGAGGGGQAPSPPPTWAPTPAVEFEIAARPAGGGGDGAGPPPRHWHVPLTWAPWGYSSYRGS